MEGVAISPFTVYVWRAPNTKRAFVFDGAASTGSSVSKTDSSESTVRVDDTVHSTDTVDALRYKIARHCSESGKELPAYMWAESAFGLEERLLFAQSVFKNEVKVKKAYLNGVCKAYLGTKPYPRSEEGDVEVQGGFVEALQKDGGKRLFRSLEFRLTDSRDFEIMLSPQPFVALDERSTAGSVVAKTRFDKSVLSKFSLRKPIVHCVFASAKSHLTSPAYLEAAGSLRFDPETDRYVRAKAAIQTQFADPADVVKEITSKIDILLFRVTPLSHNLQLNLKTIFKTISTTYDIPIVVYKSKFNNEYKLNKLALVDMSKRQLDLFHEKERKQAGVAINRANELIIFYIRISPTSFFYFLLSANGSYRVKYKSSKSTPLSMAIVRDSFRKLMPIYEMLDNPDIFRVDEHADLFNSSLVEVIEYNTQSTMRLTRPVDEERFVKNMESSDPFFAELRKDSRRKYVMQYVGTNNFFNADTISAFIYKNQELNTQDLVNKLKAYFQISESEAHEVYAEKRNNINLKISRKGRNVFAVRTHHTPVYVRIHISNDLAVKVYTSNTQDASYHVAVLYLLLQFLVRTIKPPKGFEKAMHQRTSAGRESAATDIKVEEEDEGVQFNDLVADQEDDSRDEEDLDEFDFDDIDIDFGSPHVNIEEDLDDYDLNLNDFDDDVGGDGPAAQEADVSEHGFGFDHGPETPPSPKRTDAAPDAEAKKPAAGEQTTEPTRIVNNGKTNEYTVFVLNELYKADIDLFRWPDAETKLKNYSSKCGATNYRQPVVINREERSHIDRNHPGSYNGYVQTGSTPELKQSNYYICPRIWCPVSRISITQETYEKHGNRCPPPHEEKPLFFPKEGTDPKKNYFLKSDGSESHYPSLMKANLHPHGLALPCCGKKATESTRFDAETATTTPDAAPADADDKKLRKSNYIANIASDMLLNAGQYGNLPHVLNVILNKRAACTGSINSKTSCYVRAGVENTPNSLMDAVGACLEVRDPAKHLARALDLEQFFFLNGGNTLKTYMDNERQFTLEDPEEFVLFKAHLEENGAYVERFGLQPELEYVRKRKSLSMMGDREGLVADKLKMSVVREYLIYLSYMNFRRYLTSSDTTKTLRDIQHLLALKSVNERAINFLFLEVAGDDVFLLNPTYFEYRAVLDTKRPSVLILKIRDHFEYVRYISQNADHGALVTDGSLARPIVESLPPRREVSLEERRLYDADTGPLHTYVLSTAIRCVGYVERKGGKMVRLAEPVTLRYDRLRPEATFVFEDRLDDADPSTERDLALFVASLADTQVESVASEQRYMDALHKAAKVMLFTPKLRDALTVVNHDLSNFSAKERAFLLDRIMKENKVSVPEGVNRAQIVHDLLHVPLQQIIDEYQMAAKSMRDDELVLTISDLLNDALYDFRARINRNPYKIHATASEDVIDFVDKLKIGADQQQPPSNQSSASRTFPSTQRSSVPTSPATDSKDGARATGFFLSSERTEIKPRKVQNLLPEFEAVAEPLAFADAIDLFHFANGDFTMRRFVDAYTAKVIRMYKADKDDLIKQLTLNPSAALHKIGRRSDLNDFVNLIDRTNYHFSLFELRVMAEVAEVNLLVVGRDTKLAPEGVRFVNNKAAEFVVLLYTIQPNRHSFFVVTLKKGLPHTNPITFARTTFSEGLNKVLKSIK